MVNHIIVEFKIISCFSSDVYSSFMASSDLEYR